jgi:hypothetical protein
MLTASGDILIVSSNGFLRDSKIEDDLFRQEAKVQETSMGRTNGTVPHPKATAG